jgi:hypothetical protein
MPEFTNLLPKRPGTRDLRGFFEIFSPSRRFTILQISDCRSQFAENLQSAMCNFLLTPL